MSSIENISDNSLTISFYKDKMSANPADLNLKNSSVKLNLEMARAIANGEYNINLDDYNAMNFYKVQMSTFFDEENSFKLVLNKNSEEKDKYNNKIDTDKLTNNDKFEIKIEDYASLNSYNKILSNLLNDNSTNQFPSLLKNYIGSKDDTNINAKSFIDNMKKYGISTENSVKIYGALKSYSITTSLISNNKNSFITAKV